jgi:hypothetical protein
LKTLSQSDTAEPWEHAVAACLTALYTARSEQPANAAVTTMIDYYLSLPPSPEVVLFQVRLGLRVTDIAGITGQHREAERATARLAEQALTFEDGYAAQEVVNSRSSRTRLTVEHERALSAVVRSAGLDRRAIPQHLITDLLNAAKAAQEITTRQQNAPNHATHRTEP